MDFVKAFDKVPHMRPLHKLDCYGTGGYTHRWVNTWLSGCSQQEVIYVQATEPVLNLSRTISLKVMKFFSWNLFNTVHR